MITAEKGVYSSYIFNAVSLYPWLMLSMVPVIVAVPAFNFMGDGLRDAADPHKSD